MVLFGKDFRVLQLSLICSFKSSTCSSVTLVRLGNVVRFFAMALVRSRL